MPTLKNEIKTAGEKQLLWFEINYTKNTCHFMIADAFPFFVFIFMLRSGLRTSVFVEVNSMVDKLF